MTRFFYLCFVSIGYNVRVNCPVSNPFACCFNIVSQSVWLNELSYAFILLEKKCMVTSRNELADQLNIPRKTLSYLLYVKKIENCYTSFETNKKSGGVRCISAPCDELKSVQRRLLSYLFKIQNQYLMDNNVKHLISHAFEKKKSIITNAKIHTNKKFVINIDLKDFFDSFHFGRVRGFFQKNRMFNFNSEVSLVIAQLTCYDGKLPQGAPTSPLIANMISEIMDMRILEIARKYHCDYTRYADDLTFSTNDKKILETYDFFYEEIKKCVEKSGFFINETKTNFMYSTSRQVVTGLVVNRKINVANSYYRKTRAMVDSFLKNGTFTIEGEEGTINRLDGRLSFIDNIDRYNNAVNDEKKSNFRTLNRREETYRSFLYYKYFYANSKPLILTEGKTDVKYIKAALKSLYSDYPNLIEKKEDGSFEYKISFFKRSNRLKYFFGISDDGVDTYKEFMKNFVNGEGRMPIYHNIIYNLSNNDPKNPVIIIFDNEFDSKNKKPISNFVSSLSIDKEKLKAELFVNVKFNFFVAIPPLIGEKKECEIEDLFSTETQEVVIEGRTFDRKVKKSDSDHFGKEVFSNYIYDNYKNIDFNNFRPLLDTINKIIEL